MVDQSHNHQTDHEVYLFLLREAREILLLREAREILLLREAREALLILLVIKLKPEKYHHRDRLFEVEEGKNIKQGMANETSL